jgi:integrase
MLARIEADYERKNNRSFPTVKYCFQHIERAFKFRRVVDIRTADIETYVKERTKAGASRATVNRELAYLRRGFRLMLKAGDISAIPCVIELASEDNARKGFVGPAEFAVFAQKLQEIAGDDVRDIVEFLYNSGWRSGEAKSLEWSDVFIDDAIVRLPAEKSKSKKPRPLPLTGTLMDIIERRIKVRRLDCPFVFHRTGRQIKSFRRAFKAAAEAASLAGLLPHDLRRSAVRNFRRAGLSEHEGMALSGHATDSVYRRYDIIGESDLREAMERVQSHVLREAEARKVVALKKQA